MKNRIINFFSAFVIGLIILPPIASADEGYAVLGFLLLYYSPFVAAGVFCSAVLYYVFRKNVGFGLFLSSLLAGIIGYLGILLLLNIFNLDISNLYQFPFSDEGSVLRTDAIIIFAIAAVATFLVKRIKSETRYTNIFLIGSLALLAIFILHLLFAWSSYALAFSTQNCSVIFDREARNGCILTIAKKQSVDEKFCDQIELDGTVSQKNGINTSTQYKSECILAVAQRKQEIKLCDLLPESDLQDSHYTYCITSIKNKSDFNEASCAKIGNPTLTEICFVDLAASTNKPEICSSLKSEESRANCFKAVAVENGNISLCKRINSELRYGGEQKDIYIQDDCFVDLARTTKDTSVCDNITHQNRRGLNQRDWCIGQAAR